MSNPIRLVVGLGNPGLAHRDTRHNAGFWFVEAAAGQFGANWRSEKRWGAALARCQLPALDFWLMQPLTYMNLSGRAVGGFCAYNRLTPDAILVVHDDLDLEVGAVRLKQGGGHAGHNGLKDIVAALGSPGFWRLRLGIGRPLEREEVVQYVLGRPTREQRTAIDLAMGRGLEELPALLRGAVTEVQRRLHTTQSARPQPGVNPTRDSGPTSGINS